MSGILSKKLAVLLSLAAMGISIIVGLLAKLPLEMVLFRGGVVFLAILLGSAALFHMGRHLAYW